VIGDERSGGENSNDERHAESERTLREIEERVRKVRHLEAFDYSSREDGRFQFELHRPPEELDDRERETVARLLSRLAEELRNG
jgi:hypothetical protein